jgi:hypothetical protein
VKRDLAADAGSVAEQFADERVVFVERAGVDHIAPLKRRGETDGGDAHVFVRIVEPSAEMFRRAVLQMREHAERAGAQPRIFGFEKCKQSRLSLGASARKAVHPRYCVARLGEVSAFAAPSAVETSAVFAFARSGRATPINAAHDFARFVVAHVVPADAGVIPIGDVERAIRCHREIGNAIPRIARGEHIDHRGLVTCAILLDRIRARRARAGVAVNHLILERGAEAVAFVQKNAGGRARAGLQQIRHDTRDRSGASAAAESPSRRFVLFALQPAPVTSSVKP